MKLLKIKFSILALAILTSVGTAFVTNIFLKRNQLLIFQKVWEPVKDKTLISNYKVDEVLNLNINSATKNKNPFLIYHPYSNEYKYKENTVNKKDQSEFNTLKIKLLQLDKTNVITQSLQKKPNNQNNNFSTTEINLINKYWLQFLPFLKSKTLKSLTFFNEQEYLNKESNKVFGQIPSSFIIDDNNFPEDKKNKKINFKEVLVLNKFSFPIYFEKESELPESFSLYLTRNPLKGKSNLFSLFIKKASKPSQKNEIEGIKEMENSHQKIFKNSELPNFVIWLRDNLPKMAVKRTIHTSSDILSFSQTVKVFERYLATLYSLSWNNQKTDNEELSKQIPSFDFKNLQEEDFSDCLLEFKKLTITKNQKSLCLSKALTPIQGIKNSFF